MLEESAGGSSAGWPLADGYEDATLNKYSGAIVTVHILKLVAAFWNQFVATSISRRTSVMEVPLFSPPSLSSLKAEWSAESQAIAVSISVAACGVAI